MLEFSATIPADSEKVLNRSDIANELSLNAGLWACVARPDRMARAETLRDRINDGREYGKGYAATIRKIGAEIRVYAQFIA